MGRDSQTVILIELRTGPRCSRVVVSEGPRSHSRGLELAGCLGGGALEPGNM